MRLRRCAIARFADNSEETPDDGLTLYQSLFEITEGLCKRYPALTPFVVRRERAKEVFLLLKRINSHPKEKKQNVDSRGRILVPAGDDWF